MFFYTALFVACVIIAMIVLYLYKALLAVGKMVYTAFLPSAKTNFTPAPEEKDLATTINATPTPWGWDRLPKTEHMAQTRPTKITPTNTPTKLAPWGWPGNSHGIREHRVSGGVIHAIFNRDNTSAALETVSQVVGWPYREEKFEFTGTVFKVLHKETPKQTNLQTTCKPWGW